MTERQTRILEIVHERERVEVNQLSEALKVSTVTIRKDLDFLEARGLLRREHGYAVLSNRDDLNNRLAIRYETKLRIAQAAAALVGNGETVMIESGSSCALLAEELALNKKDVTIITNSAFIVNHIRDTSIGKVVLLGGDYQKESQVMVGPLVRRCAREFYVDKFFMGTDGYIPGVGFTCGDMMRADAMKNMMESARNAIILTDSSKFLQQGVVLQSRLEDVKGVYTDGGISAETKTFLEQSGVEIIVTE